MLHSKKGRKYILVAIDYLTRWVEARVVKEVNTKKTIDFIYGNICIKFGMPLVILTDRGPGFRKKLTKELQGRLGMQHRHSSPYYPQCNGLVENANGQVMQMLPSMWLKLQTNGMRRWINVCGSIVFHSRSIPLLLLLI